MAARASLRCRRSRLQFACTPLGDLKGVDDRHDSGADGTGHLRIARIVAPRHGNGHEQDVQRLQPSGSK